ncbi:hypothetical protein [Paenibacillus apii]|uniref:hypothetical protein n=1 Tax=Paenibacillus apii TaxID=1850370 RepID=UPI001F25DB78|nr:hypothetical protein [Paenibacillus apii]
MRTILITVIFEELMLRYLIEEATINHYSPNYNAAPMQFIPAVVGSNDGNRLRELTLGLGAIMGLKMTR